MKKLIIAMSAVSSIATAQTTYIYGPNGQYQGQVLRNGNAQYAYGADGRYQGNSQQIGNTQYVYGANGAYQGQIQGQATLPTVNAFEQQSLTPMYDSIFGR